MATIRLSSRRSVIREQLRSRSKASPRAPSTPLAESSHSAWPETTTFRLPVPSACQRGYTAATATVGNDSAADVLTGSSGSDWFLFDPTHDRATDLKDEAFLTDLEFINQA